MRKLILLPLAIVLLWTLGAPAQVSGQSSSPTWKAVIAYMNPSADAVELTLLYYLEDGSNPMPASSINIASHQSGTLLVGSIGESFEGSAVVSSNGALAVIYKQDVQGIPYSPIYYSGMELAQAGNGKFHLPVVRYGGVYDTRVAIQNVNSFDIDVTLDFINESGATSTYTLNNPVPAQSSVVFKLSQLSGIASGPTWGIFDGSLVIQAKVHGSSTDASVVAVAQDVQSGLRQAFAYEGVGLGDQFIYVPTALCNYGSNAAATRFFVQNTSAQATTVTVKYYADTSETPRLPVATYTTGSLQPGQRVSFSACAAGAAVNNRSLSAVVEAEASRTIAVTAQVIGNDGLTTAFTGTIEPAISGSDGKYRLVFPYIEYGTASNAFRTYVAVMNIGAAPAVNIQAHYFDRAGALAASQVLASSSAPLNLYARRSTSPETLPQLFGSNAAGFIGSLVIVSDQPLAAVARVQRAVSGVPGILTLGEDYSPLVYEGIVP